MIIALAQIEVIAGRPDLNCAKILSFIKSAQKKRADLIVFPEMCLGGYLIGDEWNKDQVVFDFMSYHRQILEASQGLAIAFGNVYGDPTKEINKRNKQIKSSSAHPANNPINNPPNYPNKDGRMRKYNAACIFQNGKPAPRLKETKLLPPGIQPKTLLPNYRFFDDQRYFFSLRDIAKDGGVPLSALLQPYLIDIRGTMVPVGFELCEDLWCEDYRSNGQALNISRILTANGAKLIINLSASPWTYGKNKARDRRIQFIKKQGGDSFVPFLYVNCVGAQNNGKNVITFDGGSTVYSSEGLPVLFSQAPYAEELMIVDEHTYSQPTQSRTEKEKIAQKYDAIITGIRHVRNMIGLSEHPHFMVGLSGGIDSSVVAALMVQAVGRDKVLGINMPTIYNSEQTKAAAQHVASKLGLKFITIPIGSLVEFNQKVLGEHCGGKEITPLVAENIQAKIRGTAILSNLASQYGALFTNNGNKVEIATGYATLYGDVGGVLAPLGDLTKSEIFEMGRYLNALFQKEVIPPILFPDQLFRFTLPPTAELKEKQIDPFKWGYHDALLEAYTNYRKKTMEDIAEWYLQGTLEKNLGISAQLMPRWELDRPEVFIADLEDFSRRIQQNVFKRVQAPPIIVLSKSAYGYDIRESQLPFVLTRKYLELKEKILSLAGYTILKDANN